MFSDTSTIWSARGLYAGVDFDFEIPCIFSVSKNESEFNLAKIDGGSRRRGLAAQWDVHFTNFPQAAHERQAHALGHAVKRPTFYTFKRTTGYMYFLIRVMKVFFADRRQPLTQKYMPQSIKDSTWKMLTSPFSEQLEAWKLEHCSSCTMAQACKKDAMERIVRKYLRDTNTDRDISEKEIQLSIQASFAFPTTARVSRTRNVSGDKAWLKLKDCNNSYSKRQYIG